MKKAIACLLVLTLLLCFAACKGNEDVSTTLLEPTTSADETYYTTTSATSETTSSSSSETDANGTPTATVNLVTQVGVTVPTVVVPEWVTTLPATTASSFDLTSTTANFTIPNNSVSKPAVASSYATPTTSPTTSAAASSSSPTTQSPGSVSSSADANSTTAPSVSAEVSDSTTTTAATSTVLNLVYAMNGRCDDGIVIEFESDGWEGIVRASSTRVNILLNGNETLEDVRCAVQSGLNSDNRIQVVLYTNTLGITSGDSLEFTLPDGFVRTIDNKYRNASATFSIVV